jgi:hypothetical protein
MTDSAYYLGTIANNLERATDTFIALANNTATQRERIATALMAGILANPDFQNTEFAQDARAAVEAADALLTELNRKPN